MPVAHDPEISELTTAFARAVAVAERLAYELDETVEALITYVRDSPPQGADVGQDNCETDEEYRGDERRRT